MISETAKLYGGSLYELAAQEGLEEQCLAEIETAAALLDQNPDYLRLLSTPSLPKKERCALLAEAFADAHPYTVHTMQLLCEQGALREVKGCARQYRARYNEAHGILEATAVSAVPLPEASRAALEQKLCALTGKTVHLTVRQDPSVLGGIRLDMAGERLDGTVQGRLEALRRSIAAATL